MDKKEERLWTPGFVVHTMFLLALYLLLAHTVTSLMAGERDIAVFDPYQILELDTGADMTQIKKAYRKLSLKYHPDRNPDDPVAGDMFVKISKAHDVLTDDEARANYEQYGSPDGRQALQVSIGLPTFMLNRDNHTSILLAYLGIVVVALPGLFLLWWSYTNQYGKNEVMQGTYRTYMFFLTENVNLKFLPEALGGSQEFVKTLKYSSKDLKMLVRAFKSMKREHLMANPRRYTEKVGSKGGLGSTLFGNNVLLHMYLTRREITSTNALSNLHAMLIKMPRLIDSMIFITTVIGNRFWLHQTIQIIKFSQFLTQALWHRDSSLLQLPHFTMREVSICARGKKRTQARTIRQYMELPEDERKGLLDFTDDMKRDIANACKRITRFDLSVKAYVEDEEEIATNDLVTFEINITRKNLKEGETAQPVLAPHFPKNKFESVWVLVAHPNMRNLQVAPQKLTDQSRELTCKVKFRAPPKPGKYTYTVCVLSDSYVGVDTETKTTLEVISEDTLPEYVVHPEDKDLEPLGLLYDVQTQHEFLQDSDSESEDEEEEKKSGGNGDEVAANEGDKDTKESKRDGSESDGDLAGDLD